MPYDRRGVYYTGHKRWISYNPKEFRAELDKRLYGQPYAESTVEALRAHFENPAPGKALAISLHGPTGTGKNFFSTILRDHVFKAGEASSFFHVMSATVHFSDAERITDLQKRIKDRLKSAVTRCPQSVFVFDEVEKMPFKLMDTLKPYLDYNADVEGIDYRKAVFLFLSNDGSEAIVKKMTQVQMQGQERKQIPVVEFDKILAAEAIQKGGFASSSVVGSQLISRFVPFLPLERRHVRWCVQDELWRREQDASDSLVDKIVEHIQFMPAKERLFSSYGCKRVQDKVAMVLEDNIALRVQGRRN